MGKKKRKTNLRNLLHQNVGYFWSYMFKFISDVKLIQKLTDFQY